MAKEDLEYSELSIFTGRVLVDRKVASQLLVQWDHLVARFLPEVKRVDVWIDGQQVRRTPR